MVWAAQLRFGNKALSKIVWTHNICSFVQIFAADVKNDRQDSAVVVYFAKPPEKRKGKLFSLVVSCVEHKGSILVYGKPTAIGNTAYILRIVNDNICFEHGIPRCLLGFDQVRLILSLKTCRTHV